MSIAKLVQGWIDPTRIDEAAAAVAEELIPQFTSQPGAEHGYWMANRQDGHVLIMMTWIDADAVARSRADDGRVRALVAERVGLRIDAVQSMELIGEYELAADEGAQRRWVRATWVERVGDGAIDPSVLHRESVPDQSRSRGFRGSYWLGDREAGNGLALSFWDGPADLTAGRAASRRRRRRAEELIGCRIDLVTEYEAIGVVSLPQRLDLRDLETLVADRVVVGG